MVRPGHERARAGGGVRARTRKWSCLDTNGPDWRRRSGQGSEMVVPGHERALLGAAFAPRPGNGRARSRTSHPGGVRARTRKWSRLGTNGPCLGGVRARTRKWSRLDANGPDWRRRSRQDSEMVVAGHERARLEAAFAPGLGDGRAWTRTGLAWGGVRARTRKWSRLGTNGPCLGGVRARTRKWSRLGTNGPCLGGVRARTRKWSRLDANGPGSRRRSRQDPEMVVAGHERARLEAAFGPGLGNGRAGTRTSLAWGGVCAKTRKWSRLGTNGPELEAASGLRSASERWPGPSRYPERRRSGRSPGSRRPT